jgi:hypothetical protein
MLSFAGVIVTVLYLTRLLTFYPSVVALALSLTGLFLILTLQILDAKEYADHKPNTVLNWLKSYPRSKNITVVVGTGAFATTGGKARVSVSMARDAPLDKKVDFLILQFGALESAIANVDDRVDEVKSSLNKTEKNIERKIGELSSSISTRVAGHIVGAYDINLFGITITVCGTLIQFFLA